MMRAVRATPLRCKLCQLLTSRRQTVSTRTLLQLAAAAAIIVLLVMILGLNALAIFIRNKFQRTW